MADGAYPWLDYGGRLSPLKLLVLIGLFVPGTWIALAYGLGALGAGPLLEAERQLGLWTIRLLFVALAITPVRDILGWRGLSVVRRMVGVAVFVYAALHFLLYVVDQAFDLQKVVSEIVLRVYLAICFAGVLGAAALAATSTDGAVRLLGGRRWQRLHRLIYMIGLLAVVHYCMQSKLEEWEPTIMAGLLAWLMGYRLLSWALGLRRGPPTWLMLIGLLSLAAALATALGEAGYFWLRQGVSPIRVLWANLSLAAGMRPACVVLLFGLLMVGAGALRGALMRWGGWGRVPRSV